MAVAWPDFAACGITAAAPLRAIADALRERQAASGALGFHSVGAFPLLGESFDATPDLRLLGAIREYLRALAPCFVRLDDESYSWYSWGNFPIPYSGDDLLRGEHSLARLPARGTPEGSAPALDVYRTFLANCAWWLERFRYVDVSAQSFCTRRCEAYGGRDRQEDSIHAWNNYDSGTDPADLMNAPTVTDLARPVTGAMSIECRHRSLDSYSGNSHYVDGVRVYEWSAERFRKDEVFATAYSGFVVRNASGLDAVPLLVPCWDGAGFPYRHLRSFVIDSVIPDPRTSAEPDEKTFGAGSDTETDEDRHGGDWRETRRVVDEYAQGWTNDGLSGTKDNSDTRTVWNAPGTRSASTTTTTSGTWHESSVFSEIFSTRIIDFDGFGFGSLGTPVARGTIPAHGSVVAVPAASAVPFPDEWDLSPRRRWRHGQVQRAYHEDDVDLKASLRLVPILDFDSSYQYRATT